MVNLRKIFFLIFIFISKVISPKTYICTRIYCDSKKEESTYNNAGSHSSSKDFQNIYWRCACCMFATSSRNNINVTHLLFSNKNKDAIPQEFVNLFDRFNVQIITLPMKYQAPENYTKSYRNTLYILDVIQYLSKKTKQNDNVIIIDSDCIWINSIKNINDDIKKHGLLNYVIEYEPSHIINGLNFADYPILYRDIIKSDINFTIQHYGAEILATNNPNIKNIANEIDKTWKAMLEKYKQNKVRFLTDEHFLSFFYNKLGHNKNYASKYIKRISTSPNFNNVDGKESELTIWHLPCEKKTGFHKLYQQIIDPNSFFWKIKNKKELIAFYHEIFSVRAY